jgi:hypothetical protein
MLKYIPSLKTTAEKPTFQSLDMSVVTDSLSAADSLRIDPKRRHALERVKAQLRRFHFPASRHRPGAVTCGAGTFRFPAVQKGCPNPVRDKAR